MRFAEQPKVLIALNLQVHLEKF